MIFGQNEGQKLDFCKWKNAWPLSHMPSIFVSAIYWRSHKLMLEKNSKKNTQGSRLTSAFLSVPVFVFLPEKSLFGEGARVHLPNFEWLVSYY